ncbi:hypothetical protein ABMA10_04310 [Plantibacter sp. RU18]
MTTIRLTAITKHYGRHQVLQDVTLSAKPGRVTALLGPNGSGKTTTIKVLLGLTRANAGSARFDDLTYAQLPRPSASVGVLLESSGLHPGMTAQQHLHIAARAARAPLELSCPWFDGDSDRPERMRSMPALRKYPAELRERAVRLVFEARDADGGRRGVCTRIGRQLGVPSDTLRGWVQRAEVDGGLRSGTSTDTAVRLVEVEREVRELRRANAILRSASAFFAAELDRPHSR